MAHELQISRSQLVATAIAEFLKRYEKRALIEAINRATTARANLPEKSVVVVSQLFTVD